MTARSLLRSPLDALRSRWYYLVGTLVVLALLVVALLPPAIDVEVAIVDRGDVRATIIDEGRTRMREVYVVSAPVAGRLLRVAVEPGDVVERNDGLARMTRGVAGFLDPRSDAEARAVVGAAEARLRAAAAERELAAIEDTRAQKLAASKLIAESVRDTAMARLRAAIASEAAAAAELRRARSALLDAGLETGLPTGDQKSASQITLRAPVAGTVLAVPQKSEASVVAGTPVVVLGDPARIDVVAEFLSQDAVRVQPGDRAYIENWGERGLGRGPVSARVERVEPVARTKVSALGIEEQRSRIIFEFTEPIPAPLRAHDYRVDARIVTTEVKAAVRVPLGALWRQGEGWQVFVVEQGRARLRPVTLGPQDENYRVIAAGLQPGERVVVFPTVAITDGIRVREIPR